MKGEPREQQNRATNGVGSDAWLASFVGKRCRCGCGTIATHLMLGTEIGKPFPPEPCCQQVGEYCEECAEATGDEHTLLRLPVANAEICNARERTTNPNQ